MSKAALRGGGRSLGKTTTMTEGAVDYLARHGTCLAQMYRVLGTTPQAKAKMDVHLPLGRTILKALRTSNWPDPATTNSVFEQPCWQALAGPPVQLPETIRPYITSGVVECLLTCGHIILWEEDDARSGAALYCSKCARGEPVA